MEFTEVVEGRRSIRTFVQEIIPEEEIRKSSQSGHSLPMPATDRTGAAWCSQTNQRKMR